MPSGRKNLIEFFSRPENQNRIIETSELRAAAEHGGTQAAQYGRRVRDLRHKDGYEILSHSDRADIKPGEYWFTGNIRPVEKMRDHISRSVKIAVIERDGSICQTCGRAAGDDDSDRGGRTVVIEFGHKVPKSQGGKATLDNIIQQCSYCNRLTKDAVCGDLITWGSVLAKIKNSQASDQLKAMEWLIRKFLDQAKEFIRTLGK